MHINPTERTQRTDRLCKPNIISFDKTPNNNPSVKGVNIQRLKSSLMSAALNKHLALNVEVRQLLIIIIPKYPFMPKTESKVNADAIRRIESMVLYVTM